VAKRRLGAARASGTGGADRGPDTADRASGRASASHQPSSTAPSRYRWVVLAVGTAAQASTSAVMLGIAVLAPELRAHFGLTLGETGVVLAALGIGATPTLLPWGLAADRIGERIVLSTGLALSAVALAAVAFVGTYGALVALLVAAGAFSASVNAASGRAVMQWFPQTERGFALGIRQANVPIGGLAAALVLPPLADDMGLRVALLALALGCAGGALLGAALLRDPDADAAPPLSRSRPLRDPRAWRISGAGGLLVVGQIATMSFTVLFLHSSRGFSTGAAAAVLAASQLLGGVFRVGAGLWSDRLQARILPMRRLALAIAATLALVAALADANTWLLVPALVAAGGVGLSWNGLSFTAAAEIAGTRASGAALGLQQTVLGLGSIVAPIGFAALVAGASWRAAFLAAAAFPLVASVVLRPLAER
jgi:sugar phosphate permease